MNKGSPEKQLLIKSIEEMGRHSRQSHSREAAEHRPKVLKIFSSPGNKKETLEVTKNEPEPEKYADEENSE